MGTEAFFVWACSSLFMIVDPVAAIPAFLAMTPKATRDERIRVARLAATVAGVVLIVFATAGRWVFRLLGISLPAFQVAGSIVLLLVALDMLRARRTEVKETPEEKDAGIEKEDIAVTPLAVPMLAGPGACSTVIMLRSQAHDPVRLGALYGAIVLVCLASYLILGLAGRRTRLFSPIVMKVTTRLMGLLLAAIAVQFMLNGLGWRLPMDSPLGATTVPVGLTR